MDETPSERTVLFADVSGSTRFIEALGDARGRKLVGGVMADLAEIVGRFRGRVVKTIGDEVMASFEDPFDAVAGAVEMQRVVAARYRMGVEGRRAAEEGGAADGAGGAEIRIRVGLHGGPVILEDGDLHGDVVNVAARVAGMARGGQILTTAETLQGLLVGGMDTGGRAGEGPDRSRTGATGSDGRVPDAPGEIPIPSRSLGEHPLKGKGEPVAIREIIWEEDPEVLTTLSAPERTVPECCLVVRLEDQILEISSTGGEVRSLGRGEDRSLVVADGSVSRSHADITARGGRFYLEDHSTNGTWIRPLGADEIFVHRDQVLLIGKGAIRLGRRFSDPEGPTLKYRVMEELPGEA
ncbi:MAG: adenylate/guanylate cyclase domain-containing protein [Longimicrobiales bacterium]